MILLICGVNISESINKSTEKDYIYDTNFFTRELKPFETIVFISNKNGVKTPKKIKMIPYFLKLQKEKLNEKN